MAAHPVARVGRHGEVLDEAEAEVSGPAHIRIGCEDPEGTRFVKHGWHGLGPLPLLWVESHVSGGLGGGVGPVIDVLTVSHQSYGRSRARDHSASGSRTQPIFS